MDNSEIFMAKYRKPLEAEFMDHSDGPNWDWSKTRDFMLYLAENGYTYEFGVAALPHDGTHGACGSCQLIKIQSYIDTL